MLPEFEDIRMLHGAIFVRRGLYRNGIFRFTMRLQKSYNSLNTHPEIVFTPPVLNPLIDPVTGALDLTCDASMQEWRPESHYIVHALTFLKKIFYLKSFDEFASIANKQALKLLDADREKYLQRIEECVEYSIAHVYDVPSSTKCPLVFTEDKQAHDSLRTSIIEKGNAGFGTYASPIRDLADPENTPYKYKDELELKVPSDTGHIDRLTET